MGAAMSDSACGAKSSQWDGQLALAFPCAVALRPLGTRMAALPARRMLGTSARVDRRVPEPIHKRMEMARKSAEDRSRVVGCLWLDDSQLEAMSVNGGDWDLVGSEFPLPPEIQEEGCSPVIERNFVAAQLAQLGAL
ncbi:MAG: hypothetical protein ACT4PZ_13860 [Panacagrimonas sp.]